MLPRWLTAIDLMVFTFFLFLIKESCGGYIFRKWVSCVKKADINKNLMTWMTNFPDTLKVVKEEVNDKTLFSSLSDNTVKGLVVVLKKKFEDFIQEKGGSIKDDDEIAIYILQPKNRKGIEKKFKDENRTFFDLDGGMMGYIEENPVTKDFQEPFLNSKL